MWTNNTYLPKTQIFFHTYYFHFLAGYFNIFLSELNQGNGNGNQGIRPYASVCLTSIKTQKQNQSVCSRHQNFNPTFRE